MRYRQYCSRRLRRIRVGLGCTQSKREFKPQTITPATVTDVRYLASVLVQSERCWAYAMQLKNDMTAETQRKRFHLLKRLTKAAQSAKLLVELCGARADTRTQLQAEAYSAWLSASVLFERNAHDKALALFLHAKEVYDKLGSIGGSSMQILCEERVANLQDSIRFSKYMLRHKAGSAAQEDDAADDASIGELAAAGGNELLAAKLETLRQEKLLQQAQSLDTVEWQGKTVPVSSEKLRLSFVEARNLKQQLDKALELVNDATAAASASSASSSSSSAPVPEAKESSEEAPNLSSLFQRLFGCYDEALKVLRDALLEPKMLEAHKAHLLALQQYATASRLEVQIQRNQNFVSNLVAQLQQQEAHPKAYAHRRKIKPDEAVVLYEKLLANLVELNEIAQANKNAGESKLLTVRITATKALRVFYLAESYRRIRKFTESYLLYSRALETAEEFDKLAAKLGAGAESAAVSADRARMQTLKRDALNLRGQVHAQALLASAEASAKVAQQSAAAQNVKIGDGGAAVVVSVAPPALTLATRLDQYDAGEVGAQYALLDFPPSFQSAPAKPILFDLAFNAIQYPDISARAAGKKTQAPAATAAAAAAPAQPAAKQQVQKAPAAAASAPASKQQPAKAAKQPEPEPEEEEEEQEESEEEESPAPAAKPTKAAAAPASKKVIAPPGESKADKAARERREKEEAEKARLKAEAEAAKKGGWGLGGLVGKMFGR